MILHGPGDRAIGADFGALHVRHRIGGEHGGARRQRLDLVEMNGRRVEHVELADIHRMLAAGFGQPDAAAEADLAALRILAHAAAGRGGDHLQAPARAEQRRAGRRAPRAPARSGASPRCRRCRCAGRAGDGDAVIAFERLAVGQSRGRIARIADVDDRRPAAVRAAGWNSPCSPGVPPAATCSAMVCGELPSMTSRRGEGIAVISGSWTGLWRRRHSLGYGCAAVNLQSTTEYCGLTRG